MNICCVCAEFREGLRDCCGGLARIIVVGLLNYCGGFSSRGYEGLLLAEI